MSQKYVHKPTEVKALVWDGGNKDTVIELVHEDPSVISCSQVKNQLFIMKRERVITFDPGDYVVLGPCGRVYHCKPELFEELYEAVEKEALTS